MIPPAGEHGGDALAIAAALGIDPDAVVDLSLTLNPCAPDVTPVLRRHLGAVHRYPDPARATAALAERLGRADVLLTNGGAEAIALVAGHLGAVSIVDPEFSLWRRHARIEAGAPLARSNPNNPTGVLAPPDAEATVWDEAFYPLATGDWSRGDGDWVVGSLTKLLACPGLRVGYVTGDVDALRGTQPAWSVNGVVCSALPELLDAVDLPSWAKEISVLKEQLVDVLRGFDVRAADAPWVLVDAPLRDVLAPHGIVVRDCTSFGMPGTTRIGVPDERGLERLARALA